MKKKVTVIGGGNGSAISIIALKQNLDLFDISAVVSMSDSGGSSGRLREEFNTLPPGDIMRAVLALSKYDYPLLKQIFFRNRFSGAGKLDGHNLGNLTLVLEGKYSGDFMSAVRALEQSVETIGHAYPTTLDKTDLCAELDNGEIVKGEAKLDKPTYDPVRRIKKAWLEPAGQIYEGAKEAIESVDYIIFGPGSLYTSIIAVILPQGVKEAINKSKAKLIYVTGDAYVKEGESCPTTLSETIRTLEKYLPRPLDRAVYNNAQLTKTQKELYQQKHWIPLVDDVENQKGMNIVKADYEKTEGGLCSIKLGKILKELLV